MDYRRFDRELSSENLRVVDRAVAFLWLAKTVYGLEGMTAKEIAQILERECGHPRQNASRLHEQLRVDQRTAKFGTSGFRLRPKDFAFLDERFGHLLSVRSSPAPSGHGSVIPREIFEQSARSYLLRLVDQVNGCYDHGYHDGVMVLARKLLETLIIEVYVQAGRVSEIKRPQDGALLSFEQLSGKISADSVIHVTRETKSTLAAIKKFGDQSAHNQRFVARQGDVDGLKQEIRIAAEELLHLCNYASP